MSTITSLPKGQPKKAPPDGVPEKRFWIKYSEHHELPLSVTGSIFLHAVAFGVIGLILAGILSGLLGKTHSREVKPFEMAEGGGDKPSGNSPGAGEVSVPTGKEVTEKPRDSAPIQPVDPVKPLLAPDAHGEPLVNSAETVKRLLQEPTLSPKDLGPLAQKANDQLVGAIANGHGGTGGKGGKGKTAGTGIGNKAGGGSGKIAERQLRWTMIFRTSSGADYLKQLQDLGATLAAPDGTDEYLVFRDLSNRPIVGRKEDVGGFKGLRWIDDRADSVRALARSMGLGSTPPYIVAFFQEKFETQLRDVEQKKYKGDEHNIEETIFRIESRPDGRFVPVVQEIRLKSKSD